MGFHAPSAERSDMAPLVRGTVSRSRAQCGFTLIELITVIIILGILAAVVAPKYFHMADQAREEVGTQALAEGVVHFNLAYMKYAVDNSAPPADLAAMSGADYLGLASGTVQVGDFRFTYAESGTDVLLSAEMLEGGSWVTITDRNGAAMTRTIPWP